MIAVDTNVLLRYLLRDDHAQAVKAYRLFTREECILITDVVLIETLWTLMGRKYKATKTDVVEIVANLLRAPNVRFEDNEVVWRSLKDFRKSDADFADALVVNKALATASVDDKLEAVYTFDVAALQLPCTAQP